ncbi:putative mediator of RNA polymerase II transcription subunit 33A/B [Dioscorea sansibarensis]
MKLTSYTEHDFAGGTTSVMLLLPMAALVSLTIAFKLDKNLEYIHGVIGPALNNCASGYACPLSVPYGLKKICRWHNFIVFSCLRSPFSYDKEAIAQLVRSCFSSFLRSS